MNPPEDRHPESVQARLEGSRWLALVYFRGLEASVGLHATQEQALAEAEAVLRKLVERSGRR